MSWHFLVVKISNLFNVLCSKLCISLEVYETWHSTLLWNVLIATGRCELQYTRIVQHQLCIWHFNFNSRENVVMASDRRLNVCNFPLHLTNQENFDGFCTRLCSFEKLIYSFYLLMERRYWYILCIFRERERGGERARRKIVRRLHLEMKWFPVKTICFGFYYYLHFRLYNSKKSHSDVQTTRQQSLFHNKIDKKKNKQWNHTKMRKIRGNCKPLHHFINVNEIL